MLIVFIVGDILGAGIYALVGKLAGHVGGMVWLPLAIGFAVAALTAGSYAELVGKYPRAAGAALYTHRAFDRPFVTFLVAFAVMMSGVASASAAARRVRRQVPRRRSSTAPPMVAGARLPRGDHARQLHRHLRVDQGQPRADHRRGRPASSIVLVVGVIGWSRATASPAVRSTIEAPERRRPRRARRDRARLLRADRLRGLGQPRRGVRGAARARSRARCSSASRSPASIYVAIVVRRGDARRARDARDVERAAARGGRRPPACSSRPSCSR